VAHLRPSCWTDVLTLLADIDQTVADEWEADGKGAVERLRQLAMGGRRPQDVSPIHWP
jgi:hypothetical protein